MVGYQVPKTLFIAGKKGSSAKTTLSLCIARLVLDNWEGTKVAIRDLDHRQNSSTQFAQYLKLPLVSEDQADFRPWLEEDMFPARQRIGFRSCASFNLIRGHGSKFVTLYETTSVGNLYDAPYQALRQKRNLRDADYHRKFQNPQRYTLSWIGPEISKNMNGFSNYIILSRFNLKYWLIPEFNRWFVCNYIPSLSKIKNTLGLRRFMSLEGPHKHLVIEEILNPEKSQIDGLANENIAFETHVTGTYKRIIQAP